jgi:hypothetical protein
VARPSEREHRDALRRTVLTGVPATDIHVTHRFFVGVSTSESAGFVDALRAEAAEFGDVEMLDLEEGGPNMGTKRWMMLNWVSSGARVYQESC